VSGRDLHVLLAERCDDVARRHAELRDPVGTVIWVLACQIDVFLATPSARAALMSAIIVSYSALTAWEFWRNRDEGLMSRLPIVVFLLAHAAIVVIRIPLAGSLWMDSRETQIGWWTFIIFEAVFFSFCVAYLLGGMARERIVLWYKHASLIDPLTGVGNRRAFLEHLDRARTVELIADRAHAQRIFSRRELLLREAVAAFAVAHHRDGDGRARLLRADEDTFHRAFFG